MSFDFPGNDDERIYKADPQVTGSPMSFFAAFKPDSIGANDGIIGLDLDLGASAFCYIALLAAGGMSSTHRGSSDGTVSTSTYTASTTKWNRVAVSHTDSTQAMWFHNGTNYENPTASDTVTGAATFNGLVIGNASSLTFGQDFAGLIAECGFWNEVLTDEEGEALVRGMSPLLIRPWALVHYVPLVNKIKDYIDPVALSTYGTQTVSSDHPTITTVGEIFQFPPSAAVGGANPHFVFGHPFAGPFAGPIG